MQDLEELGLLTAPHTSAERMPIEIGLRLFVDDMMQAGVRTLGRESRSRSAAGRTRRWSAADDLECVSQLLDELEGKEEIAKPVRALDDRVVGVIGPTRLNYARVVPMRDFTAATLARLLA